jgi:tellurium resistance protein TerD
MTETTLDLSKGQKADLTKTNPGLTILNLGLGWDVGSGSRSTFDLDATAVVLRGGKLANTSDMVYFKNLKGDNGAIVHKGDNLTGAGDGDDEVVSVDLTKVSADVSEVVFVVNIYEAESRNQNFGQVANAFIRVVDTATNQEIMRYDLSEDFSGGTGVVMGKLYRYGEEWKFQALGEEFKGDLNKIVAKYS